MQRKIIIKEEENENSRIIRDGVVSFMWFGRPLKGRTLLFKLLIHVINKYYLNDCAESSSDLSYLFVVRPLCACTAAEPDSLLINLSYRI